MRKLLVLLLLFGCADEVNLSLVCPQTCYTFDSGIPGEGICRAGTPKYDEKVPCKLLICANEVGPQSEICDGIDNNCNGGVDEYVFQYRNPCPKQFGVCGEDATWECRGEQGWVCDYGEDYEIEETSCDGRDNDCDGATDEIALELCYTGEPAESVLFEPCRAGIVRCVDGALFCDDVTPAPEVLDCKDNDCDGIIDEGFSSDVDVVYAVDDSGSYDTFLGATVYAIKQFHTAQADPNYRFAVVGFTGGVEHLPLVHLKQNFTDLNGFTQVLNNMSIVPTGNEASLDVVSKSCDGSLGLAFREAAKKVLIVFTDEQPQSYTAPPTTAEMAVEACQDSSVQVFFVAQDYGGYSGICDDTGGRFHILSSDHADTIGILSDIFTDSCN